MGGRRGVRGLAASALVGAAAIGALADHAPLGAVDPTNQEQLGIYTLNRARDNPTAYGTEIGFDLGAVPAQPPLAMNRNLTGSARFHTLEMFDHHYYNHVSEVTGDGPNAMAVQNGYDAFGMGLGNDWGPTNTIESIARGVNQLPTLNAALKALIIDLNVVGAGHRVHLMAMHPQYQAHREIGMGVTTGVDSFPEFGLPKSLPTRVYAIQTANNGSTAPFLTGVVFRDLNANLRFDGGEGLGGVSVSVAGGGATETGPAGGWSLPVTAGAKVVECTGGAFPGVSRIPVTVGTDNIEIDFHAGQAGGEVSFAFRDGLPAPLGTTASATLFLGQSPAAVTASATGAAADLVVWELDGDFTQGSGIDDFAAAGLHPVFMDAYTGGAWASDVAIAVVDDSAGPGEGRTFPSSQGLLLPKGLLKRSFKLVGKDQAKLSATFELPGGFAPEGEQVQVCIGGALKSFTLDAKGKAKDLETGSTIAIKAKWPAEGAGVAAGTTAKLTAVLKGDLAKAIDHSGVNNRTAATTDLLPVALYLSRVGYRNVVTNTVKSTYGKAGKGVLAAPTEE
jgi:hypothetical protein